MAEGYDFVESFKAWIIEGQITDAPSIFLESAALMIMSLATRRNIYFDFGNKKFYPNFWMLIVAKSALFRKSTVLNIISEFTHKIDPDLILPQEFSSESFSLTLSEYPQGVLLIDEFITLLKSMNKEYSSNVKQMMTELFDRDMPWTRRTIGGGIVEIRNPFLNIFAATTPAWFQKAIGEDDIQGGFIPRFLLIPAWKKERQIDFPNPGDPEKLKDLESYIKELSRINYGSVFSPKAKEVWNVYSRKMEGMMKVKGDIVSSFLSRLVIYVLKVAMLYHISDATTVSKNEIGEAPVERAIKYIELIRLGEEKILDNLAFNTYQIKRQKVLDTLEWAGEEGIMWSNLLKKMRMPSNELHSVLSDLEQEETVESTMRGAATGKQGKWYRCK